MTKKEFITISEYTKEQCQLPRPIFTGWLDFDIASGGFYKGELSVFGGRPAMGKTDLMMRIALWLEMSGNHVVFLSPKQDINLFVTKFNNLKDNAIESMGSDYSSNNTDRIHLYLKSNIRVEQVDGIVQDSLEKFGDCIYIIDNVTSLEADKEFQKEHYKIQYIMQELKKCVTTHNIPLITSVGLNRRVEYRMGEKRPMLSDLRGSGEMEEIADKVGLIYRPGYYGIVEDDCGECCIHTTEIVFVKNSYGRQGSFTFENDYSYAGVQQDLEYDFKQMLDKVNSIKNKKKYKKS